jgi:hypothetical protein
MSLIEAMCKAYADAPLDASDEEAMASVLAAMCKPGPLEEMVERAAEALDATSPVFAEIGMVPMAFGLRAAIRAALTVKP